MKWFTEKEFKCRCCGELPLSTGSGQAARENIKALVANVLDPLREKYGKPIVVNSGFRCPKHNAEVGGVANSQHMKGEAADVCCADNERLAEIIEQNGCYDQLIRYLNKDGSIRFIHVSWKRNGANRKMKFNK